MAILRDAVLRTAPQDEVRVVLFCRRDLISFMESIHSERAGHPVWRLAAVQVIEPITPSSR
jgi:hypothetical protein